MPFETDALLEYFVKEELNDTNAIFLGLQFHGEAMNDLNLNYSVRPVSVPRTEAFQEFATFDRKGKWL